MISKLIAWLVAFPVTFTVITAISVWSYLTIIFNMPYDIWQEIEEAYSGDDHKL